MILFLNYEVFALLLCILIHAIAIIVFNDLWNSNLYSYSFSDQHPVKVLCRKEISSMRKWNIHSIIHIDAILHLVVCCLLLHFHAISPVKEKLKQKRRKVNKMHTFGGKATSNKFLLEHLWNRMTGWNALF